LEGAIRIKHLAPFLKQRFRLDQSKPPKLGGGLPKPMAGDLTLRLHYEVQVIELKGQIPECGIFAVR